MDAVRIEWLQPDGRGVGRGPRGLVRVEGAIPGDLVQPEVLGRKGRTVDARIETIAEASPDRIVPSCPWDAACGGCDLSSYAAEARRAALARMVGHTLGLDPPTVVPSPRAHGHRARIKLAIEGGELGYRAHRSHELVPIETCRIARPEVAEALERLRAFGVPAADSVEIRTDGTRTVFAFRGDGRAPDLDGLGDAAWNGRTVAGDPTLELDVLGHRLRASPESFFQVNLEANELLVQQVVDRVVELAPERLLDLYAGIGNLTLPLASATGVPVAAVELEGSGIADLRHNAARAGLPIEAHGRPVERHDPSRTPFDVAVLDPPRSGARGVLTRLARLRPRGIVYVSCDIRSARRDLREASDAGYRLVEATCFDLFPQTHHIETVLVLERA